jgi:hypothetical protein
MHEAAPTPWFGRTSQKLFHGIATLTPLRVECDDPLSERAAVFVMLCSGYRIFLCTLGTRVCQTAR